MRPQTSPSGRSHHEDASPTPWASRVPPPPITSARHQDKRPPSFTLPRSFSISAASTSATPYIHAGLKELRDMFDLDAPVITPDEENLDGLEARVDVDAAESSVKSSLKAALPNVSAMATSSTSRGLRLALVTSCLFWLAIAVWGLRQDSDLFSSALLVPMLLPLPLSFVALILVQRDDSTARQEVLDVISKVYKAHILLQALVGVVAWESLSDSAVYRDRHAGSLVNRATFAMVSIAQAALPVAAGLAAQWWLACAVGRAGKQQRASPTTAPSPGLLPYAAGPPATTKQASPQPMSPPASPLVRQVPATSQPASPRSPSFKRLSSRSRHHHRRTVSQPVLPLGLFPHEDRDQDEDAVVTSNGLSSEQTFFAEPLLARGVREGVVMPRRSRTWESSHHHQRSRSILVTSSSSGTASAEALHD